MSALFWVISSLGDIAHLLIAPCTAPECLKDRIQIKHAFELRRNSVFFLLCGHF